MPIDPGQEALWLFDLDPHRFVRFRIILFRILPPLGLVETMTERSGRLDQGSRIVVG